MALNTQPDIGMNNAFWDGYIFKLQLKTQLSICPSG